MNDDNGAGVLCLDDLCAVIKVRVGDDFTIAQREHGDGSSEALLTVAGHLRAAWRARLVKIPPRDGVTPRGPKEYYDLQFFEPPRAQPDGRAGSG